MEQELEARDASAMALEQFRAELEVFSGPMDLLLHLVKQEEVDILEVSLANVTERYLAAVRAMQFLDINVAAEFLVIAAALTEIKSRMLLPAGAGDDEEEEDDPGAELVRRLLEYKEFKEAAGHLAERAEEQSVRFPRARRPTAEGVEDDPRGEALLEDLAVWDLMAAFAEVIEQTQLTHRLEIVRGDVPVSAYIEDVLEVLRSHRGPVEFLDFFRSEPSRSRVVGVFLALLELFRRKKIEVQERRTDRWRISVSLRREK